MGLRGRPARPGCAAGLCGRPVRLAVPGVAP